MDEIDKKQQEQIDELAAHKDINARTDARQDAKDEEHDRRFARYFFVQSLFLAWMLVLTLAAFVSVFVQNDITVTVRPRQRGIEVPRE